MSGVVVKQVGVNPSHLAQVTLQQRQRQATQARQQQQALLQVQSHLPPHYNQMRPDQQGYLPRSILRQHMAQLTQPMVAHYAALVQQYLASKQGQQAMSAAFYGSNLPTLGTGTTSTGATNVWFNSGSTGTVAFTSSATTTISAASHYHDMMMMGQGGYSADYERMERIFSALDWTIRDGQRKNIHLPDGTWIEVLETGAFLIHDKDAKVIYRANRVRDFNRFMNVSDQLEAFVAFCAEQKVEKSEFLELPLGLFMKWLVLEAAKADREDPPAEIKLLPDLRKHVTPRCVGCGHYLPKFAVDKRINFCAPPCFETYYNKTIPLEINPPQVENCVNDSAPVTFTELEGLHHDHHASRPLRGPGPDPYQGADARA